MVNSLDSCGKWALNAYYDKNSDFWKYVQKESIAQKFYANPEEIMNIYHYTNYESLEKIISSKKFFLGSIHYMNDTQEMNYTFNLLEQELSELKAPLTIYDEVVAEKNNIPWDVYIGCFSENDHSQSLLNYGEMALGFKSQNIMNTLATRFSGDDQKLDDITPGNAYVFPLKVEYDPKIQREHIKAIAKMWLAAHKNYNKDPDDMDEIIMACLQAIYLCSLCFKNPYLRQEEEIRYAIIRVNDNRKFNPEFYIGQKPFVSCNLLPDTLDKVILSKDVLSEIKEIKSFLNNNGFITTKIESTKLPY